jgi:hypothetical protein
VPRATGRSDLTILVVAGVAMAMLTAAGAWLAPPSPSYVRASTWSAGPDGAKAAFLTLRALGYEVERSFEPVGTLRVDPASTTIILASPGSRPSTQDRRALQRFVEQGGIVVATGAGLGFLPHSAQAAPADVGDLLVDRRRYRPLAPGPLTRDTAIVHMAPEGAAPLERAPYTPIFVDGEAIGVLAARIGRGRVVWWSGSTPLLNTGIEEAGHLELLLNALGPPAARRILWDEHYHGQARSLWSYLAATPLPFGLAQVAMLAAAALVTFSRRRGAITAVAIEPRASALEFVDAMAALYRKADAASSVVEVAAARLRRLLGSTAQLPGTATDAQLVTATAARCGLDTTELASLLADARRGATSTLSSAEALPLVQRLQDASTAVLRAQRGRS